MEHSPRRSVRSGMETGDAKHISPFDLDALREAFKASAREQGITGAEWAVYAQLFLKRTSGEHRVLDAWMILPPGGSEKRNTMTVGSRPR